MQPRDFVLAVTLEQVKIPNNMMGRLEGRSSLGRLGIVVHSTASILMQDGTGSAFWNLEI